MTEERKVNPLLQVQTPCTTEKNAEHLHLLTPWQKCHMTIAVTVFPIPSQLFPMLWERLVLPPHYGDNLDALYDALTDIAEDTVIKLLHGDLFEQRLGWYGRQLMRVLKDAVEDNDYLKLADVKDGGIPV